MTRVLFFGTHPHSFNGYCIVTYNLAKQIADREDIDYTIYGFQHFVKNQEHMNARTLPPHVYVYDAFAGENPKQMGFGFDQAKAFVTMNRPDVCVIYNDMVVVSNIINQIKDLKKEQGFKIIVYIDQVYLYQRKEYIDLLNENADFVLCFTEYWEGILKGCGIKVPTGYLPHGFDPMVNYPVPKKIARKHFGLQEGDFIILNLNRNQPRKRWDVCLSAFAELVSRHLDEPIKLLIATGVIGAWNLMEIYERELKKRGISMEEGKKHIILIDNPQQLTDEEVNILYNVADIGINTCDGEGFGLCNFQQAGIGIPQVIPYIGGFQEFFTKDNAMLIQPKFNLYIESTRDGVGGESEICDWRDFVDAIDHLYCNQDDARELGKTARKNIIQSYPWDAIGNKFHDIIKQVAAPPASDAPVAEDTNVLVQPTAQEDDQDEIALLNKAFEDINITQTDFAAIKDAPIKEPAPPKIEDATAVAGSGQSSDSMNDTTISSNEKPEAALSKEELLDLKKKIERLLSSL